MDRRDILPERPVERGRGYMPGVSVNPSRVLFTAGLTGRNPDGSLVAGGVAPQTHRAFERFASGVGSGRGEVRRCNQTTDVCHRS